MTAKNSGETFGNIPIPTSCPVTRYIFFLIPTALPPMIPEPKRQNDDGKLLRYESEPPPLSLSWSECAKGSPQWSIPTVWSKRVRGSARNTLYLSGQSPSLIRKCPINWQFRHFSLLELCSSQLLLCQCPLLQLVLPSLVCVYVTCTTVRPCNLYRAKSQ